MTRSKHFYATVVTTIVAMGIVGQCFGDALERAAIGAHQDQLQNLVMKCQETRTYDIDPAVASQENSHFPKQQFDLRRAETFSLKFAFLNGNVCYDRETDAITLAYWAAKGLPAIVRQIQSISATGRVEELTTQRLTNGSRPSFGGFRQLGVFSPDITIDIAMGLRLLGGHQWISNADLAAMEEDPQSDPTIIVLHASDGTGHVHELRFDKRLLFALVYYRCSNSSGASVEITNSNFHRYGNVFIPGRIMRRSNLVDSKGQVRHPLEFALTVKDASVNDPENTLTHYSIAWPANLHLFDARTNDSIEVGPTARTLSDNDIYHQLAERNTRELMLEGIARQRIRQALDSLPTTRP
jgi:hypothetical protein